MCFLYLAICYNPLDILAASQIHFQITAVKNVKNANNKGYLNEIFKLTECIIKMRNAN